MTKQLEKESLVHPLSSENEETTEILHLKRLLVTLKQYYEKNLQTSQVQVQYEQQEKNVLQKQLENTHTQLTKMQKVHEEELCALRDQQITLKTLLDKSQHEIAQMQQTLAHKEQQIGSGEDEKVMIHAETQRLQNELVKEHEQVQAFKLQLESQTKTSELLEKELSSLKQGLSEKQNQLQSLHNRTSEIEDAFAQKERLQVDYEALKKESLDLSVALGFAMREQKEAKEKYTEIESLVREQQQQLADFRKLQTRLEQVEEEKANDKMRFQEEIYVSQKESMDLSKALEATLQKEKEATEKLLEIENVIHSQQQKLSDFQLLQVQFAQEKEGFQKECTSFQKEREQLSTALESALKTQKEAEEKLLSVNHTVKEQQQQLAELQQLQIRLEKVEKEKVLQRELFQEEYDTLQKESAQLSKSLEKALREQKEARDRFFEIGGVVKEQQQQLADFQELQTRLEKVEEEKNALLVDSQEECISLKNQILNLSQTLENARIEQQQQAVKFQELRAHLKAVEEEKNALLTHAQDENILVKNECISLKNEILNLSRTLEQGIQEQQEQLIKFQELQSRLSEVEEEKNTQQLRSKEEYEALKKISLHLSLALENAHQEQKEVKEKVAEKESLIKQQQKQLIDFEELHSLAEKKQIEEKERILQEHEGLKNESLQLVTALEKALELHKHEQEKVLHVEKLLYEQQELFIHLQQKCALVEQEKTQQSENFQHEYEVVVNALENALQRQHESSQKILELENMAQEQQQQFVNLQELYTNLEREKIEQKLHLQQDYEALKKELLQSTTTLEQVTEEGKQAEGKIVQMQKLIHEQHEQLHAFQDLQNLFKEVEEENLLQKIRSQEEYEALKKEFLDLSHDLGNALKEQKEATERAFEAENIIKEQQHQLTNFQLYLERIEQEKEELKTEYEQLKDNYEENERQLETARLQFAKKVKEVTVLHERMEEEQNYLIELSQTIEIQKSQIVNFQSNIDLYQKQEKRLQEQLYDSIKGAEIQIASLEEKYSTLHDKWQKSEARVLTLEKIEEKHQHMQNLLANFGNVLGTPMSAPTRSAPYNTGIESYVIENQASPSIEKYTYDVFGMPKAVDYNATHS